MPPIDDSKESLRAEIGDISGMEIAHNQIIVAIYKRPERTKGGIILTDNTRGEDEYQSKVGLVLAVGPTAFNDPEGQWSWPPNMGVGDWIYFRASDGWGVKVNGVMCRQMDDTRVRGRLDTPERIW